MKDILAVSKLTFKIAVGVELGMVCSKIVTHTIYKVVTELMNITIKKLDNGEDKEPHMEVAK